MKKLICIFIIISLIPSICVLTNAEENVEILFSETFEGDLSRWSCDGNEAREKISINKSEDEYIGAYVSIPPGKTVGYQPQTTLYVPVSTGLGLVSPFIKIEASKTYTLAVDINSRYAQHIGISYFNENKSCISTRKITVSPVNKNDWWCYSLELNSPDTADTVQISLLVNTDSSYLCTACYDNVLLCKGRVGFNTDLKRRKIYAPTAKDDSISTHGKKNVLFYETFENGKDNWTYYGNKSEKNVKVTNDNSSTGKYSLYLNDALMETPIGLDSKVFSITPGAEYTLAFESVNTMESGLNISIRFLNDKDKLCGSKQITTNARTWSMYSETVEAPQEAKTAQIRITSKDYTGKNYIDNIYVTLNRPAPEKTEDPPVEGSIVEEKPTKYDEVYNKSIVLFIGSPNATVNGEKTMIDPSNANVVADIVDSRTLVPARFIAENYGADVDWDDTTKTVTLTLPDKTVTIVLNQKEININDISVQIDVPAQSIEGRTMLPLRAFVEQVMNKSVFWDARGLIVITDTPQLDSVQDAEIIDRLLENVK